MDPIVHQIAERGIDRALALDAGHAGEGCAFDDQREMALAAVVMASMADVMIALVFEIEPGGRDARDEPVPDFGGDGGGARFGAKFGGGGDAVHHFYIER